MGSASHMLGLIVVLIIFQSFLIHKGGTSESGDKLSEVEKELSNVKNDLDILRTQNVYLINLIQEQADKYDENLQHERALQATFKEKITKLENFDNSIGGKLDDLGVTSTGCHWTTKNDFDASFTVSLGANEIIQGINSNHDNGKEDRQFSWK